MTATVLVVEDHEKSLKMLRANLELEGIPIQTAKNAEEALVLLQKEKFALILSDLKLPGKSGLDLLSQSKRLHPSTAFIIMTAYGDVTTAVYAMRQGAQDFVEKPLNMDELLLKIRKYLQFQEGLPQLIGETQVMREIRQQIERIAHQSINSKILILGESGTGKEVVAQQIHTLSARKGPFVAVNCSAIPATLWESEVFGYVKNAFTGASTDHLGYFQQANHGTLFLDEFGDIPLLLQSKLLRVIETGEVLRLGATAPEKVELFIIFATNADLAKMVETERFRKDLFYRISGVQIHLPPLRERVEDIPLLVDYFLKQQHLSYRFTPQSLKKLQEHSWDGNIRDLFNVLLRTITFLPPKQIEIQEKHLKFTDLPTKTKTEPETESGIVLDGNGILLKNIRDQAVYLAESRYIEDILEKNHWNRTKSAKILGISYKTLLEKIKFYNLAPPTEV
ncbi:MAG: sigma-54 dependent transcriptional regulator [Planctomycetota bacterium]